MLYFGEVLDGGLPFPEHFGRGPGARPLDAESIGRAGPFLGPSARLAQKAAGPGGTRRIAPIGNRPGHLAKKLRPLIPGNQKRLLISACNGFAPGPGDREKATFPWRYL